MKLLASVFDEALAFFWDELRKKKQERSMFHDLYGDLLPVFVSNHQDFAELCQQKKDWAPAADKLKRCIASGLLGRRLFSTLQQYICGAQVAKRCRDLFPAWEARGEQAALDHFEDAITDIATQVANSVADLTDGIKRVIELSMGNLMFEMDVSSFQEDR